MLRPNGLAVVLILTRTAGDDLFTPGYSPTAKKFEISKILDSWLLGGGSFGSVNHLRKVEISKSIAISE